LCGKWDGSATSIFPAELGARSEERGAKRCRAHRERRATTTRREISMSLWVARGRGAAASWRLDDAPGIACGAAPNSAPSSCNADPSHSPDRLPRHARPDRPVNLPNLITLGRLLCVPLAIWLV